MAAIQASLYKYFYEEKNAEMEMANESYRNRIEKVCTSNAYSKLNPIV